MYQVTPGIPVVVLGTEIVAAHNPVSHTAAGAAQAMLPYTGVAVGLYLVAAFILLVTGFVLRHLAADKA